MRRNLSRQPRTLFFAMQLALGGAFLALTSAQALAAEAESQTPPQSPDILLGPLFADVQTAKLFPDQKTFADAVPKSDPYMILADYRMQRNQSGFDLRHFVEMNFTLPAENEKYVPPAGQTLRQHIDGLWTVLTRTTDRTNKWDSLLPLPEPYVVPGGRFREIYYWDSYFTMLGLAESGHWDKVEDMVANFAHEIDAWGHIPNGNRTYYLSRSQPPFFAFMVELLASHKGDDALKTYRPQLEKEYSYWMEGAETLQPGQANKRVVKLEDGSVLNRYWDDRDTPRPESWLDDVTTAKNNPNRPATEIYRDLRSAAASGWDFSSRWMDDPNQLGSIRTTSIVPVDLNALMFKMEKVLARASQAAGDSAKSSQYDAMANARQKGMEANLLKPGGIATTTVNSGQQWDAPNGWAPLQWVATAGLQNYGQDKLAMDVTWRFLSNVQHTYDREQKLVEKYDVSSTGTGGGGGEYPLQDGFGWTNGVTLMMLDQVCPKAQPCDSVPKTQPAAASATPSTAQQPAPQSEPEAQKVAQ